MTTLNFTPAKAQALRKAYKQAVKQGAESFLFEEQEVLTSYAKYLIEFLVLRGLLKEEK